MSLLRKLGSRFVPALLLGSALYLGLIIYADWHEVVSAFGGFRWSLLAPALALAFGNYVIRYLRWEYYLRDLEIRVPIRDSLVIFFCGLIMSITPGKLGEVLKSYLLKRTAGIPISLSAPIVVAERFTDFIALVILSSFGVALTGAGRGLFAFSLLVVLLLLGLVSSRRLSLALIAWLETLPWIGRLGDRMRTAYGSVANLISWKALLVATPVAVVAWFLECLSFGLILRGFDVPPGTVSLGDATFIYSLGTIAGALTMLPGGIGATEGVMTVMLQGRGLTESLAVSATFVVRVCTLWFAVLVGMIVLLPNQNRFSGVADEVLAARSATEIHP